MPCIFCVAVLMLIAGALTSEHLDQAEDSLREKAEGGRVKRTVDSESVAKFELTVKVGNKSVPVAVTIFKDHKRVRIQVLTHDLSRQELAELEEELADALDAEIVDHADKDRVESVDHTHPEDGEPEAEAAEAEREQVKKRDRS